MLATFDGQPNNGPQMGIRTCLSSRSRSTRTSELVEKIQPSALSDMRKTAFMYASLGKILKLK